MKKLLLVFALLLSFNSLFASHLAGGEIWYEYIGDSIYPYRYKVYLQIYRDVSGVPLCQSTNCSKTVCITSSCYGSQSISLDFEPFTLNQLSDTLPSTYGSILTPGINSCVSNSIIQTEQYLFTKVIDLPGNCSDYSFSFSESSRNPSDNLQNGDSKYLYLDVILNNTLGQNNSPVFLNPAVKSFCAGFSFEWSHQAYDADGDSLFYVLSIPQSAACGNTPTPIAYNPGYHQSSPITSSPPFHFNITNGLISFTPVQQEVVTFRIDVFEYRKFNNTNYYLVGRAMRDVQIPVVSSNNCGNFTRSLINDTILYQDSIPQLSCGDSTVLVKFNQQIHNNSIAPDGSDFAITNSYGQLIPIKAAIPTNKSITANYCYGVNLKLLSPLNFNDSIDLTIRTGSDLNTLVNTCGYQTAAGDSLSYEIKGCQTSIAIKEHKLPLISLYPNPANDGLHITSSKSLSQCLLQIYDLQGMLIRESFLNSNEPTIDIKELPSSFYLIRLSNNDFTHTVRFQKL